MRTPPAGAADIQVVPVWKQVTPALVDELTRFWLDHNAIANVDKAALRAQQAVVVARDGDGALCGVATAVVRVLPRLRQPLYYYRQFFAPRLRGRYQALTFFRRAKQVLQAYNASLARPESLGLLMELENPQLAAGFRRAFMPQTQSVFIGYSPAGLQLRVSYFDDAMLLPPAALAHVAASRP
jgi:hypothetical protein